MRVLLAPIEVAGVAGALRAGLRRRGHDAELVVLNAHPFGLPHDRVLTGYGARAALGLAAPFRYDVLHYQFGTTPFELLDAAWARATRRPLLLMHYWGDDCRLPEVAASRHPARARVYDAVPRDVRTTRRRLRLAGRLCHAALVSDRELLAHVRPFFRTVYVVPTPVELPASLVDPPSLDGEGPIVFHAPSSAIVKGTAEILAALERLAATRPLRVRTISGVPRADVLAEAARADVVVDQLNSETPGVFALEAMALGRPVVLEYDARQLAPFACDAPLVAATAATLAERVAELCDDETRRRELGEAGRRFVHAVHDADRVAAAAEHVYAHARARPAGVFVATAEGVRPLDDGLAFAPA
ncbi:MAG TPA: glycosyltransferase [Conexibacter sp.]|nr:glycosyltransferase [Conexibacter sp.]